MEVKHRKQHVERLFSMAPEKIIINLNGNDLSIERHSNFQGNEFKTTDKLTLDGKECKNAGFMDTEKNSVVSLSDDKKVITVKSKIPMQDGGEMSIKEVYSIENENSKLKALIHHHLGICLKQWFLIKIKLKITKCFIAC
jgi:hypothetical protein